MVTIIHVFSTWCDSHGSVQCRLRRLKNSADVTEFSGCTASGSGCSAALRHSPLDIARKGRNLSKGRTSKASTSLFIHTVKRKQNRTVTSTIKVQPRKTMQQQYCSSSARLFNHREPSFDRPATITKPLQQLPVLPNQSERLDIQVPWLQPFGHGTSCTSCMNLHKLLRGILQRLHPSLFCRRPPPFSPC
jgi:hypothetical protein